MLALSFATFLHIALSVATALAPRASDIPISYYRPTRQCPNKDAFGTTTQGYVIMLNTPTVITCIATVDCDYNTVSGLSIVPMPMCAPSVAMNTGCQYECPTTIRSSGYALTSAITQLGQMQCVYNNGAGTLAVCEYDRNGVIVTSRSSTDCYGPLVLDCGATPTKRRNHYRGKDNYTAWLERRMERETTSGPASGPKPLPGPLPRRR